MTYRGGEWLEGSWENCVYAMSRCWVLYDERLLGLAASSIVANVRCVIDQRGPPERKLVRVLITFEFVAPVEPADEQCACDVGLVGDNTCFIFFSFFSSNPYWTRNFVACIVGV